MSPSFWVAFNEHIVLFDEEISFILNNGKLVQALPMEIYPIGVFTLKKSFEAESGENRESSTNCYYKKLSMNSPYYYEELCHVTLIIFVKLWPTFQVNVSQKFDNNKHNVIIMAQ